MSSGRCRLLLLFTLLSLFSFPIIAYAGSFTAGQIITINNIIYKVLDPDKRTLSVFGCNSNETSVILPSTISIEGEGIFTVVQVAGEWSQKTWKSNIESVIISDSIKTLVNYCFNGANLKTLTLSKGVETISRNALLYLGTRMGEVKINGESPYYEVDNGVLYTKGQGELVYVPSALNSVSFTVNDKVKKIRTNAFASNQNIEKIILGKNVSELDNSDSHGIVAAVEKVNCFEVADGNSSFKAIDGVLYNKDMSALVMYPPRKIENNYKFKIPESVDTIRSYGFGQTGNLITLDLSNVKFIANRGIYQTKIEELTIPKDLHDIKSGIAENWNIKKYSVAEGHDYFSSDDNGILYTNDYSKLLYFPSGKTGIYGPNGFHDNMHFIAEGAFSMSKLSKITIPERVDSIGYTAFFSMGNLTELEFQGNSKLKFIGDRGIHRCTNLEKITFPASLETIDILGISDNPKLEQVIFPDSSQLATIGNNAFHNNSLLVNVTFNGSCKLKTIGDQAFMGCSRLKKFDMPASVTNIGNLAFGNCDSLTTVTFPDESVIKNIGQGSFSTSGIIWINLPPSIEVIEREAFRECKALQTVNVSTNANNISPEAFKLCENLTKINVDRSNTAYSSWDGILLSKDKETLITFPAGKEQKSFILLPPSLKSIGDYAFYACKKLTNVVIPNKVTSIGSRAFGLCSKLNTITFLCDEMIDPDSSIVRGLNISSFDDDKMMNDSTADTRGNITLHVRKELLSDYQNSEFYKKFNGVEPSFIDETSRVGGLNKSKATEEFIKVSDDAVDLLSVVTDDETYVLPTSVTIDNKPYAVKIVGDYLFTARGSNVGKNVKEVVVPGKIEYIGARAFIKDSLNTSTSSSVENVFIIGSPKNEDLLSTTHFKLTAEDLGSSTENRYDEFGTTTKIYVRELALDTFKTAWTNYADNIDYKIPYTQSGTFGTFAREFDVSFSEVNGVNEDNPVTDNPVVIAFTGDGKYHNQGNNYYVHMTSINLGDQTGKDGTYIPAGSGVLIKKYREPDATSGTGLYYQIAESGISPAFVDGNFMKGVTVRKETIGTGDGVSRFYISGGKLHEMTQPKQFSNHKSYMEISNNDIPAGSKVMLSFIETEDETGTTSIDNMMADENADDADKVYYNLNGQRVYRPSKGIYILNGKKVIVK